MSAELAKEARAKMRAKADRLTTDPHEKVDSSSWTPPEPLRGEIQTGPRPVSKQSFRRGGQVSGEMKHHAGRKPRKSGGRALVDDFVNRDVKEANEDRAGIKHDGGMKRGGAAEHGKGCRCAKCSGGMARANGGPVGKTTVLDGTNAPGGRHARKEGGGNWIAGATKNKGALHRELHVPEGKKIPAKKLEKAAEKGGKEGKRARLAETLKGFDREGRKHGGKTSGKGKMNVNVIIAPQGGGSGAAPMAGGPPPMMKPPGGVPVQVPPPPMPGMGGPGGPPPMGAGPPMPPPGMAPGAPPPMMPRKRGGRAVDMDFGAGGGLGRLEKIKRYGGWTDERGAD